MTVGLREQRAVSLGMAAHMQRRSFASDEPAVKERGLTEIHEEHRAWLDEQPTDTLCALCGWQFSGTAEEGREQSRAHREQQHPETIGRRTTRKRGIKPGQKMSDAEFDDAKRLRDEKDEQARLDTIERGRQRDGGLQEPDDSRGGRPGPSPGNEHATDDVAALVPPRELTPDEEEIPVVGNPHSSPASDRWNRDAIIEAIQAHAARTGFVPVGRDFAGPSTDERPNIAIVKRTFGSWGDAIVAAGYPRPQRGQKPVAINSQEREEQPAPAAEPVEIEAEEEEPAGGAIALREPIRTADIPYDADILEDEAAYLRRRADALDNLAGGIRVLAAVSRDEIAA